MGTWIGKGFIGASKPTIAMFCNLKMKERQNVKFDGAWSCIPEWVFFVLDYNFKYIKIFQNLKDYPQNELFKMHK